MGCCIAHVLPSSHAVPFCTYNTLYRNGRPSLPTAGGQAGGGTVGAVGSDFEFGDVRRGITMIVVCAGMFRSGSTWQYQVACELLRRAGRPTHPLGFLEGEALAAFLAAPRQPDTWYVYKTHAPDPLHSTLDPAAVRVLYSYRDLRDVTYSMAHKLAKTFDQTVREERILQSCLAADAFWSSFPGVFTQQYEDWLSDNRRFVLEIAAALGLHIPPTTAEEVSDLYRLERNRARTDQLTARLTGEGVDLSDPANALRHDADSLLHWNHLRSGGSGDWRRVATASEKATLLAECGAWLVARGYEPDSSWAG